MRAGVLTCLIVMLLAGLLTPYWWRVMAVPLAYALLRARSGWQGFGIGAVSAGLLWAGGSLYFWLDGGRIMAARVAAFSLDSEVPLIVATTLIAVIAGGLSGAAGGLPAASSAAAPAMPTYGYPATPTQTSQSAGTTEASTGTTNENQEPVEASKSSSASSAPASVEPGASVAAQADPSAEGETVALGDPVAAGGQAGNNITTILR